MTCLTFPLPVRPDVQDDKPLLAGDPVGFGIGRIELGEMGWADRESAVPGFTPSAKRNFLLCEVFELREGGLPVNKRLILCGFGTAELLTAKLLALLTVIGLIGCYVGAITALFFRPQRSGLVLLGFVMPTGRRCSPPRSSSILIK